MIVCCPTCHTLFRNRMETTTAARCGRCGASVTAAPARSYRVRAVLRPEVPVPTTVAARPLPVYAGIGLDDPSLAPALAATGGGRTSDWTTRWNEERARASDADRDDAPDRRLEEYAADAAAAGGSDRSVRYVLFGVGLGAISGVAASKGFVDTPWMGWATGGIVGGLAGALWDRARGWRRR